MAEPIEPPPSPTEIKPPPEAEKSRPDTVLIIEDDPTVRSLQRYYIDQTGLRTAEAVNEVDVTQQLAGTLDGSSIAGIILDWELRSGTLESKIMAGPTELIGGLGLLQKLRRGELIDRHGHPIDPNTPVLFITGYHHSRFLQHLAHHGIPLDNTTYVLKPDITRPLQNWLTQLTSLSHPHPEIAH